MGACGVQRAGIDGRTSLQPGEGRTIRLQAVLTEASRETTTFHWELPNGERRQGEQLEYTPPAALNRFDLRLRATNADGDELGWARTSVSVPPAALARLGQDTIRIEGEDFTGQGGGEVRFYEPFNASGKAFSHWNRSAGHWLEWEFDVTKEGNYLVFARYTTAVKAVSRSLTIDGVSPTPTYDKISFPGTGGWSVSADNWDFKQLGPPLCLTAGKHRIRMTNLDSVVNFDYLVLTRVEP